MKRREIIKNEIYTKLAPCYQAYQTCLIDQNEQLTQSRSLSWSSLFHLQTFEKTVKRQIETETYHKCSTFAHSKSKSEKINTCNEPIVMCGTDWRYTHSKWFKQIPRLNICSVCAANWNFTSGWKKKTLSFICKSFSIIWGNKGWTIATYQTKRSVKFSNFVPFAYA